MPVSRRPFAILAQGIFASVRDRKWLGCLSDIKEAPQQYELALIVTVELQKSQFVRPVRRRFLSKLLSMTGAIA